MKRRTRFRGLLPIGSLSVTAGMLALAAGCRHGVSHGGLEGASSETTSSHAELVQDSFDDYLAWGRVDDRNRWAPELCRLQPGGGRISRTRGPTAHARKLYYLYAKDRAAYVARPRAVQPVGQILIKESFAPEALPADVEIDFQGRDAHGHFVARHDGGLYHPGEPTGLFAMVKVGEADMQDTDAGWVYAVTDPTGARIERAGLLSDCMSCHQLGTTDRLYGVWP